MNAAVGTAMAFGDVAHGGGDPLLWGALGTVLGVLSFLLAGLLTTDTLWLALLPTGLYLEIHLIEGEAAA